MKKLNINEIQKYNPSINYVPNEFNSIFRQKKFPNIKLSTIYSFKRTFSDFNSSTHKQRKEKRLKLEDSPIIKDFLNKKIKSNSVINITPKTTNNNQNILNGPSFYLNESIKHFTYHQKALFGKLLYKRFSLKKPRFTKSKINEINILDIKNKYYNNISARKKEKKHRHGTKVINLKDLFKIDKNKIKKYKNIKFFSNDKLKKKLKNEPVYDIIEFKNNKELYANRLIVEEDSKNRNNNFDCHSLMKFPDTFYNISIFSSNLSNSGSPIKHFNNWKNKRKNSKIDINKLKITNLKGLEKMRINHYINLNQSITKSHSMIKSNRDNYKKFIDLMAKTFNKQEEEVVKGN